ncbi:hypothetical protein L9F63_025273, partial [Diploptera punctata]
IFSKALYPGILQDEILIFIYPRFLIVYNETISRSALSFHFLIIKISVIVSLITSV